MTQLKTLKDLSEGWETVDREELREEAIKWVKELNKTPQEIAKEIMPSDELLEAAIDKNSILNMNMEIAIQKSIENSHIIGWIKNFFVITDEELK